jgi:hypothetical protein
MAHWRKIDCRIWNDEKFLSLSDKAQFLFVYILTHPNMTCLGAMKATLDGLAAERRWDGSSTRDAIFSLVEKGMLVVDEFAHYVGAPHWFKYNPPERPFGLEKLWTGALDKIPECPAKQDQILRSIQCLDGLGEKMITAIGGGTRRAMLGAIRGGTPDGVAVIEIEPEPEKEKDQSSFPFATANEMDGQQPQLPEAATTDESSEAGKKPKNGHSRRRGPKGEEDTTPLPFATDAALRALTSRCSRVVPPADFNSRHGKLVKELIRAFPDIAVWNLVGDWLAAGGVAYMSFIGLDCLKKNFGTWVPVSERWKDEGCKPLTKRAATGPRRGLRLGDA